MKNFILIIINVLLFSFASIAQNAPQSFNYQSIIRDGSGVVMANESILLQVSILNNSSSGEVLYKEEHSLLTNNSGIANLQIGQGELISGEFTSINWAEGAKWLKIDLNSGSGFTTIGSMQLLSVPYALYAASSGTTGPSGTIISCGSNNSNYIVRGDGTGNWICDDFMKISPSAVGINTEPSTSFDLKVNGNIGIGYVPSSSYDLSVDGNAKIEDYLGIGSYTSSSYELDVDGDVRIQDWLGVGSSPSTSYDVDIDGDMRIQDGLGIGTSPPYSGLYVGSSYNFYVKTSLSSGSGVPLVISSGEVKEQSYTKDRIHKIENLSFNLDHIFKLTPKKFVHDKNKGGDGSPDIGLMPEEVETLIPELVIQNKSGEAIGIKHDKLSLYLLEVIKTQDARINTLENLIQAQQEQIQKLLVNGN